MPFQQSPSGSRRLGVDGELERRAGDAERKGDGGAELPAERAASDPRGGEAPPALGGRGGLLGLAGTAGISKWLLMFLSRRRWTLREFSGCLGDGGAMVTVLLTASPLCLSPHSRPWRRRAIPFRSRPNGSSNLACACSLDLGSGLLRLELARLDNGEALRVLGCRLLALLPGAAGDAPALKQREGLSLGRRRVSGETSRERRGCGVLGREFIRAPLCLAPTAGPLSEISGGTLSLRTQDSNSGDEA